MIVDWDEGRTLPQSAKRWRDCPSWKKWTDLLSWKS
jgi:hypothetical protein